MILCFATVGIFSDKWHNADYLKSIEAIDETPEDRPAIDYSIITLALLGFASEIVHIFVQIFTSFFCAKKAHNLAKIGPEPKASRTIDAEVKIEQDSIEPMAKDQSVLERKNSEPKSSRSHEEKILLESQDFGGMAEAEKTPLEESVRFNPEEPQMQPIVLQRSVTTKPLRQGTWSKTRTNTRLD